MEDKATSPSNSTPETKLDSKEKILSTLQIGDIIYLPLNEADGLILKKGFSTRKKYVVIVGFTSEGIAIGALLINSRIDLSKQTSELLNCQYPLLHRNYLSILNYDSWLDCSDIFELSNERINGKNAVIKGRLIEEDKLRVMEFLKETDVIDNFTKKRFGIL